MSGDSSEGIEPAGWLPAEMVAELSELLAVAEAVEPVVAALAARYHRLSLDPPRGGGGERGRLA